MTLIPTILCGGASSRLRSVSREIHPKPFIRLADGQSLLQKAFLRGATLPGVDEILTVTNRELFFKAADDYAEVNSARLATKFILEPFGRNTAAAVAAATLHAAANNGEDAMLLVLPADHLIADSTAFAAAVERPVELATSGSLVTFGMAPEAPETGYGYIQAAGDRVARFVERPALDLAKPYLASGDYLWNSGMFCLIVGAMLREMAACCPDVLEKTRACLDRSRHVRGHGVTQVEPHAGSLAAVPEISLDFAVMERSRNVSVVPCNIGWSDIGSWAAVGALSAPDAEGNRVEGTALLHDAANCFVQSNGRMVGRKARGSRSSGSRSGRERRCRCRCTTIAASTGWWCTAW